MLSVSVLPFQHFDMNRKREETEVGLDLEESLNLSPSGPSEDNIQVARPVTPRVSSAVAAREPGRAEERRQVRPITSGVNDAPAHLWFPLNVHIFSSSDSNVEQRPLWDRVEKLQPRPGSGSSSGSNSSSQASPGDRFRPRCESPGTVLGHVSITDQIMYQIFSNGFVVNRNSILIFSVLVSPLKFTSLI